MKIVLKNLRNRLKNMVLFNRLLFVRFLKGYEIIAGERRFRASQVAGMPTIPAVERILSISK